MSGHAAIALVLLRDRGQFATQLSAGSENPFHRVKGNLRFPLTFTYHGRPSSGPSAFFVTDPLGYRKLKLGERIGLLAPTEREAISHGDDQPAY